ncbi:MAG: WcaI family glycosyltransferase [Planctomycetes bacterium]|nr:WcaI family glycosyltransferase [Planctomycetota bacterium]
MSLRLSIYSYNYAPEPTGIPFYNTGMATWLHRHRGWRVTMHTGLPHYPWWRVPDDYRDRDYRGGRGDEVIDGVVVERVRHFVPTAPVGGRARMRLDASWLFATARRSLGARRRPHALVVVAPPFLGGLLGWLLALRFRVPVVYHVQDLQVDAALELKMIPQRLGGLLLGIERFILERMDLVTTVSRAMRARLQAKAVTRRPVALFPNWADTAAIAPWAGPNPYRREWGVRDDEVVVMYSGNLGKKQGVELLLEAVTRMRVPVRLVVAGEGVERAELAAKAQALGLTTLLFLPLAPAARLAEFLSAADLHCIPQRRAAAGLVMPSKLLNIMAVARPVVVTADPGTDLAAEVERSGCGVVAPPEDAGALAGALDGVAGDRVSWAVRGAAGRRYVQSNLGIDAVVGRFAAGIMTLVNRRRRP